VLNLESKETRCFVFGSTNYKVTGIQKAVFNIVDSFHSICSEMNIGVEEIIGLVLGLSGCDAPEDYKTYRSIIETMNIPQQKVYICNDSELAFYSIANPPGICVVSGTGSIAVGFTKNGETIRCGGWGSPLSDEGSGYWIGAQVLKSLSRYCDKHGEFQPVYEKLRVFFQAESFEEMPFQIANLNNAEVASSAVIVMTEAEAGDLFCKGITLRAAAHVAEIATAVYRKLNFAKEESVTVVTTGGIFGNNAFSYAFQNNMKAGVSKNNLKFSTLNESPAESGIRLAKDKFLQRTKV